MKGVSLTEIRSNVNDGENYNPAQVQLGSYGLDTSPELRQHRHLSVADLLPHEISISHGAKLKHVLNYVYPPETPAGDKFPWVV